MGQGDGLGEGGDCRWPLIWGLRWYTRPSPGCPIGVGDDGCGGTVRVSRFARPRLPHHGYRIGVRYDDYLLRLTGGNRYPWWGDGGGYALTLSRSVVEGAPSHPFPTMGTASGCGKTREGWVPHRSAVRRCGVSGMTGVEVRCGYPGSPGHAYPTMDTASGCGKTREGWVPHRGAVRRCGVSGTTVCARRVEATPEFIPELLRLTVSPLSALLPGWSREAIYLGSVVSSCPSARCDNSTVVAATTPPTLGG